MYFLDFFFSNPACQQSKTFNLYLFFTDPAHRPYYSAIIFCEGVKIPKLQPQLR